MNRHRWSSVNSFNRMAMSNASTHQFVFMTCRAGAEGALKQEVARVVPEWHVSYSRPGFLTFKHTGPRPLDDRQLAERNWTFAHAHGVSLGKLRGESLSQLAELVWNNEGVPSLVRRGGVSDVHVWQREPTEDSERELPHYVTPLALEVETAVRAAAPAECAELRRQPAAHRIPTPQNSIVLDVVLVEPGEWWIGYHHAVTQSERWPGGALPVDLPPHAVSRAYAKLEEAIRWSGLPLAASDECVEIGCAPGGASQALLDRGLFVTGVDPAAVDPALVEHPRFRHLRKRGSEVQRKEFLGVRWLVADMNIPPEATIEIVESIAVHPALTIRGLILTLKLSEWPEAERLPDLAARVRGWGFRDVRLRQLVSGGQEVCLVALRRKALRRLGRSRGRKRTPDRRRASGRTAKSPTTERTRQDQPHESPAGPHF
jgi:23S rRNA (cytidine2498-2'-O)-methyltransferase